MSKYGVISGPYLDTFHAVNVIVKWKNHPSIQAIAPEFKNRTNFSFNFVSKANVLKGIKVLDVSKAI